MDNGDASPSSSSSSQLKTKLFLPAAYITFGILGSVCSESMHITVENKRYAPFHSSVIVFAAELLKMLVAIVALYRAGQMPSLDKQYLFATHGLLYFINNSLYFWILSVSPTAAVNILLHVKLPLTALLHHFWIRRQPNIKPWIALTALFFGVVMTQLNDKLELGSWLTVVVCTLIAWNSSLATNYNEKLLKSLKSKSFWEQQFFIYVYGCVCSGVTLISSRSRVVLFNPEAATTWTMVASFGTIFFFGVGGISTGFILKSLDNIVKLIASVLSTVMFGWLSCLFMGLPPYRMFLLGSLLVLGSAYYYGKWTAESERQQYQALSTRDATSDKSSNASSTESVDEKHSRDREQGFDKNSRRDNNKDSHSHMSMDMVWPLIYSIGLGIALVFGSFMKSGEQMK